MRYWFLVIFVLMAPAAHPQGQLSDLSIDLSQCWNVGSLSGDALHTTVTVEFYIDSNGRPDLESISLVSGFGGDSAAIKQAFEAARRAIIRCGSTGFHSVDDISDHMTVRFHAEEMRIEVISEGDGLIDV